MWSPMPPSYLTMSDREMSKLRFSRFRRLVFRKGHMLLHDNVWHWMIIVIVTLILSVGGYMYVRYKYFAGNILIWMSHKKICGCAGLKNYAVPFIFLVTVPLCAQFSVCLCVCLYVNKKSQNIFNRSTPFLLGAFPWAREEMNILCHWRKVKGRCGCPKDVPMTRNAGKFPIACNN